MARRKKSSGRSRTITVRVHVSGGTSKRRSKRKSSRKRKSTKRRRRPASRRAAPKRRRRGGSSKMGRVARLAAKILKSGKTRSKRVAMKKAWAKVKKKTTKRKKARKSSSRKSSRRRASTKRGRGRGRRKASSRASPTRKRKPAKTKHGRRKATTAKSGSRTKYIVVQPNGVVTKAASLANAKNIAREVPGSKIYRVAASGKQTRVKFGKGSKKRASSPRKPRRENIRRDDVSTALVPIGAFMQRGLAVIEGDWVEV